MHLHFTILLLLIAGNIAHCQPSSGCFIGAYTGCGSIDSSCTSPAAFNQLTGKSHYCFSRYVNAGDDFDLLNASHWQWTDTLRSLGAKPVFFLMPFGGLENYSNGTRDSALTAFSLSCLAYNDTVFIVFGHEMNGSWNPYGGTAQDFVNAFDHVSLLMKSIAPKIRMCWIAIQAWGQNAYLPYYPGDTFVDWVGLNLYDRDYDENNQFNENQLDSAISYLNFYTYFAVQKNKPMMIGENSLYDPNWDPSGPGIRNPLTDAQQCTEKNQWIGSLYEKDTLQIRYPALKMIIFFHVKKPEFDFVTLNHNFGNLMADWRIPVEQGYDLYAQMIRDPYFIGGITVGTSQEVQYPDTGYRLKVVPNPAKDQVEIHFYLAGASLYHLSILDVGGKIVLAGKSKRSAGGLTIEKIRIGSWPSGSYLIKLESELISLQTTFFKQ